MKRTIAVFISIFWVSLLVVNAKSTVVSGQMKSVQADYLLINRLALHPQFDTIYLDAEKNFSYELALDSAAYFELRNGQQVVKLFLLPNKSLEIYFNTGVFGASFVYGGKTANYNSYLQEVQKNQQAITGDKLFYGGEFQEVFAKIDSLRDSRINKLEKTKKIKNAYFVRVERLKIEDSKAEMLLIYTQQPKKLSSEASAIYSSYFSTYFETFQFDQPELNNFQVYQNAMLRFVDMEVRSMFNQYPEQQKIIGAAYRELFASIKRKPINQEMKNILYYSVVSGILPKGNYYDALEVLVNYAAYSTDLIHSASVKQSVDYFVVPAIGTPVPEMTYLDIEGKEVSISDFKGKYVYIDVWATWCGPCKREIPKLEKLGHELEGENIVFVSVSTDKNKAAWERMVKGNNMHGVQLHAGPGGSISQVFRVTSIPRFILLDREGKVLNPIAPRPSVPGIKEYFLSLEGIN